MCSAFENYIYLKDEIRTISRQKKGQVDNDCEEDNFIFTQKFLAITIIGELVKRAIKSQLLTALSQY